MKAYEDMTIWMAAGSQHLYGEETLQEVERHAREMAAFLGESEKIPARVAFQGVLTSAAEVSRFCAEAVAEESCGGVIFWMHTFSPAKMWIDGLNILTKPMLHLHTQYNRDIPWGEIDMDFMNLNQSAHGGREHGFVVSRMKKERKVVVGHWRDEEVLDRIDAWMRAAAAVHGMKGARVARFGDNMRDVAVTEGDKVAAQIALGYNVQGFGLGDLAARVDQVEAHRVEALMEEYQERYELAPELKAGGARRGALRDAARLEAGLEDFLREGGFCAFTTTFENLHGLSQLPGLACQRLMEKGFGFGAEGDWKTAALIRAMKIMGRGLGGGTSFMEDYTYHFDPEGPLVLGAHMLEVCPSIAGDSPIRLELHPLGIGGKDDPARLVFDTPAGGAVNASLMDMGNRFRLLINEVETLETPRDLPCLPVARALWAPKPDVKTAAAAWIYGGGAHHTAYSRDVTTEMLREYARICGVEALVIDGNTDLEDFRNTLRWNDLYYTVKGFSGGI